LKNPNDRSFTDRQSNSANAEKAKIRAEKERLEAIERARIEEEKRQEEIAREVARKAEQAKRDAERPRKVLLEAVQYMQMRTAGKRR
jgi:hypothetical protein